jgi:hypothetical protein
MSATGQPGQPGQPSEEELRAAYEAEIKKIRIEQIVLEQVVSLVNLGMRRTGLAPGTEDERDVGQVQLAIESVRALLPVLERAAPGQIGQIRDALSQLQMAFVRLGGAPGQAGEADGAQPGAAAPGARPGPGTPAPGAAPRGAPGTPPDPRGPAQPEGDPAAPGEGGPAQRSGRLWVPGQ